MVPCRCVDGVMEVTTLCQVEVVKYLSQVVNVSLERT